MLYKMDIVSALSEKYAQIIEEQLETGNPPETREAFERLRGAGYPRASVISMLSRVYLVERETMLSEGSEFDRRRYARMLTQLPQMPNDDHWDDYDIG
jgi:hypothetical protein